MQLRPEHGQWPLQKRHTVSMMSLAIACKDARLMLLATMPLNC